MCVLDIGRRLARLALVELTKLTVPSVRETEESNPNYSGLGIVFKTLQ